MQEKVFAGARHYQAPEKGTVVTIGNFDGVHLGHQRILECAFEEGQGLSLPCGVLTFRPHPREVLGASGPLEWLNTYEERAERLLSKGMSFVIEEPFTREFSTLSAESFFKRVLVDQLKARSLVVGYDFAFGRDRGGSGDQLKAFCTEWNIALEIVDPIAHEGEVVSSSRIRTLLKEGRVNEAASLLGDSFQYKGVIVRGDQRGRQLGYKTANLDSVKKLMLKRGVYATKTHWKGGVYRSVTNIGLRPTFHDEAHGLQVETHILDFDQDLYGQSLEVEFLQFLRAEQKFDDVESLKNQIAKDVETARRTFDD